MGFVYKSFYVTTGSEEFPVGDTDALRLSRSQTLLTKCAQALIACNVGWQLDTDRNATGTSYVSIPDISGSYTYPGLFFRNTISGCKLFMAYFGGNVINNGIKDFGGDSLVYDSNAGKHGGLCMSIIPAGSTSEFGDPTQSTNSAGREMVNVCFYTADIWQPERAYSFTSRLGTRWSPIGIVAVSSGLDKSDIEIVPGTGNGFKGYLDTDLFRCGDSGVSRGTTFDNGKWIVLENSCGWFFGWEPGNDSIGELS